MKATRTIAALGLVALLLGLDGCAHVRPWERETLAAPGMQTRQLAPIVRETAHVVAVREASRGGSGTVGGGCGCN